MSTTTESLASGPVPHSAELYRFTVVQYDKMLRDGTIGEDDPVELLDGFLVLKMSKNPRHRVAVRKLVLALERALPPGWHVAKEEAIELDDHSKPEPDVAVIRAELEFDATRDPTASDCALVVEVADTSLGRDRNEKARIYASSGIPAYWIVNLIDGRVEVLSEPTGCLYASRTILDANSVIRATIAGADLPPIAVGDLLP